MSREPDIIQSARARQPLAWIALVLAALPRRGGRSHRRLLPGAGFDPGDALVVVILGLTGVAAWGRFPVVAWLDEAHALATRAVESSVHIALAVVSLVFLGHVALRLARWAREHVA